MQGKKLIYTAFLACALSSFGMAQDAPASPPPENAPSVAPVGGTSALDFIRLDGGSPSIPLRNAGVIRNSETVDLDGRVLKRGQDYSLDYPTGMIILMTAAKPGQTLRVSYRHDPAEAKSGTQSLGQSWNTMKLNFGSGTTVMMGLGMAERGQDGSIMRSDLYGMKNSFGLNPNGTLKMNGVFAYSSRKSIRSQSLMGNSPGMEGGKTESGSAIVQELGGSFAGGQISLQYQSIDKQFSGFGAFGDSGYSQQQIDQLAKERGLKRMGLSLKDVQAGSMKLNQSYQFVGDRGNSIRTQSFSAQGKGWSLAWGGRKVDQGFSRFNDLRESDRQLLQREAGLRTSTLTFGYDQKGTKFSASDLAVTDTASNGVKRRILNLQTGTLSLGYKTQEVDAGFSRFQGIREADAGQLAREQGIKRQSFALDLKPNSWTPAVSFNTSSMERNDSGFHTMNFTVTGRNWSYDQATISNDAGFDGPGRQSEAEQNENINRVATMYQPTGIQVRPEERQWFARSIGLERSSRRISFSPGKGIGVSASELTLTGTQDTGRLSTAALNFGKTNISFRHQSLGNNLVEIGALMGFERERLGNLAGLDKTDFSFSTSLGANRKIEANSMTARLGEAEAGRRSFRIQDPRLDIQYVERHVDTPFFNVSQLVDPDRELLGQMIGQEQRQLLVNVMLMRGLNIRMNRVDAENDSLAQKRSIAESLLAWDIDKDTKIQWYRYANNWTNPSTLLLDQSIDRLLVSRNFTGLGALSYEREVISNGGETTSAPDSTRNSFTAEATLDGKTSLRTEQSRTEYGDGNHETVSAHTVSTGITKGAGLSVTDVKIERTGDRPNERRRNYGFWVNLGGGVKFTYGYARELGQNGTLNSTMSLTAGQFGGLDFGGVNYQHQRWDDQRDRSTGNFKIGTSKPIQLGFLRDFRFNVGTDTVRDYNAWQRENQTGSIGARIGDVQLGFDYTSQVHTSGKRAVDRSYRISTPKDGNRKLSIDAMFKVRTMPWDQQYMIRNINVTGKFLPGFDLSYQTQSYPEQPRGDALLGTVVQPLRTVAWKLTQNNPNANTRFGMSWEERINEQSRQMTRLASVSLALNANSPSPLRLTYGMELGDLQGNRKTMHRYSIEFTQRPGPNQLFSLSAGNVSWQRLRDQNIRKDNWTFRMEYQLRF